MGVAMLEQGNVAVVRYVGTLADGTHFDSTEGLPPLKFTIGANQVIPGFEEAVRNMDVGSTVEVTIPPEKAYGFYADYKVETAPMISVPQFADKEVGEDFIIMRDGLMAHCRITKIVNGVGTFDFNHPLAGQDLHFSIELLAVE